MAKLTSAKRNALPGSVFALPGRKFPINDLNHAKNAKARAAHIGGSVQKRVDAKVKAKFHI